MNWFTLDEVYQVTSLRPSVRLGTYLVAWLAIVAGGDGLQADERSIQQAAGERLFEQRIRPVLVRECYECHSGQSQTLQGQLRLDSRPAMRKGGESGPAVVPGKPEDSLILEALRHESFEMPPNKQLPDSVVADFSRWIEMGAPDPRDKADAVELPDAVRAAREHWAFQPIQKPLPPQVGAPQTARTPIDLFVLEKLDAAQLTLNSPADRRTLIRRLSIDLLGLPPSPAAVAAFVADESPNAYERLVDRLLSSPQYGERWARHWLDVARYADNKGYVFFEDKNFAWAWTYRDYVIRAFNEDMPFDRFVTEQLTADQLPLGEDRRALAALGFLTLGARFMNNTHDVMDDRIDVVTRGLMGLTVTCARCHDHKFDPISQADYYALYGVFRSSPEPMVPPEFLPAADSDAYRAFQAGLQQRLDKLSDFMDEQRQQIAQGARQRAAEYLLAVHRRRNHPTTENFMLITDKGALNPAIIRRWETYLNRTRVQRDEIWSVWHAYSAIPDEHFATEAARVYGELFSEAGGASDSTRRIHPAIAATFRSNVPASIEEVANKYGALLQSIDDQWLQVLSETKESEGGGIDRLTDDDDERLRQVLYGDDSPAVIPQQLSWGFLDLLPDRPTQNTFKELLKEVEKWTREQPGAPPRAMVLEDSPTPFDPVIFTRGNPYRKGAAVPRRFIGFLDRAPSPEVWSGSGRMELAGRITAADNPLTARVLANRIWQHHFGQGLVTTPSDFGLRSQAPSHPELLDWLASTLIEQGWSIKSLHRLILLSATYRQSSDLKESERLQRSLVRDPNNRLLWKFRRRRMSFETMRDSLLEVAGLLNPAAGGPPQPLLAKFIPRRTVYGFINRMDLPGVLRSFDFPEPAASSGRREQTTVAPQALFFLNNDFVQRCAAGLQRRISRHAPGDERAQIRRAFQILFHRDPDSSEYQLAADYLAGTEGDWSSLLQTLLMTNEFLFVD